MILADYATHKYKIQNKSGSTMRNMPFSDNLSPIDQEKISKMQSMNQIGATLFMFGNLESCFSPLFAIQLAALLMTLVRKGIITSNMWHLVYNISLWINIFVYYTLSPKFIVEIFVNFYVFKFLRIQQGRNKYLVWSIIFLLLYVCQHSTLNIYTYCYERALKNVFIIYYLCEQIYYAKGLFKN
jgi:hypothetical protein